FPRRAAFLPTHEDPRSLRATTRARRALLFNTAFARRFAGWNPSTEFDIEAHEFSSPPSPEAKRNVAQQRTPPRSEDNSTRRSGPR
ncbi:MAG TPA: hypothetical protein VIV60_13710, partial [Polyangiaceae bacterium]